MGHQTSDRAAGAESIAAALRALRSEAGEPSYAHLAKLVGELRVSRGVPEEASVPARTTVYDLFRAGRRRVDHDLVDDLLTVLAAERERGQALQELPELQTGVGQVPALEQPAHEEPAPEKPAPPAQAPHEPPADSPEAANFAPVRLFPQRATVARIIVLALALNLFGHTATLVLNLPIWLDMTGTAVAAVALGPWWGAGVAVASMGVDGLFFDHSGYAFLPVSVAGALVWGYGVRAWRMARSSLHFLVLSALVALVCTAIAAPITYFLFGGYSSHDSSRFTETIMEMSGHLALSVLSSNLVFSLIDKVVSGFVALAVLDGLSGRRPWLRERLHPERASHSAARKDGRAVGRVSG